MKINLNYDLINKIREAKIGINLRKTSLRAFAYISIGSGVALIANDVEVLKSNVMFSVYWLLGGILSDYTFSYYTKEKAIKELKLLSQLLKKLYINTNYELLLKANEYESKYRIAFNDKFPHLKEEKYIMIPVYVDGEEKEVSLCQEHIIGTNNYVLSYGSPQQKVYKMAYSQSF